MVSVKPLGVFLPAGFLVFLAGSHLRWLTEQLQPDDECL